MSILIQTLVVAVALIFVTGAMEPRAIRIENEDMGMLLSRNAVDPPGDLICDAGEVEYRVDDQEIFDLAFTSPSAAVGAWVEKVQLGPTAAAHCIANRYPAFGPPGFAKSYNVAVRFNQCGYSSVYNSFTQLITHSNVATIVLRLPAPSPVIIRRKTFTVPLHCVGSAVGNVVANTQYFQHIIPTGPIFEQFGVTVSVKVRKDLRDLFLGEVNTTVNVITLKLDSPHNEGYDLIGHRCWATPTSSPTSEPSFEFISPRGCNPVPDFVHVTPIRTEGYLYEIKDFALDDSGELYFHCEVNVCYKGLDSTNHCRPSSACPNDSRASKSVNTAPNSLAATSPAIKTDKRAHLSN